MIVRVRVGSVEVVDAEDLTRFHVDASPDVPDVAAALEASGFGTLDGASGEALVEVAALRRAVGDRVPASWEASFAGMLAYAARQGWLAGEGTAIRAHVERTG